MRHLLTLSAALFAFGAAAAFGGNGAQAAAGEGNYCLTQALNQAKNCSYQTLAQCIESKGAPADDCSYNGPAAEAPHKKMHRKM